MKVAVCVKQVPDTTRVEIDPETHTLRREGIESVLNPLDTFAIEQALRIRETHNAQVTALTMGPPQAENTLRQALAYGVDKAMLICGKEFAGSDTWATSLALAHALETHGPFDLILCGKQAIDGDTAHVGPETAAHLGLPQVTFVRAIRDVTPSSAIVERVSDRGVEIIHTALPAVLTVLKDAGEPRLPNLKDLYKSRFSKIRRLNSNQIGLATNQVGLEGSPTRVVDMFSPKSERKGSIFEKDCEGGIDKLLQHLERTGVLEN